MENEIKVNEYIRTTDGKIGIFVRYSSRKDDSIYKSPFNCFIRLQNRKSNMQCCREYIVKHSPNITGVLKKGDLIYTDYGWVWYDYKEVDTIVVYNGKAYIKVDEREIHKIYTKEMMESISYKVTKM